MLPSTIQWYFPRRLNDAVKLIQKDGVILHGGGTKILEPQPRSSVKGLVDIGDLGLDYIRASGRSVRIGAAATFADVVRFAREKKRLNILGTSLSHAASTPLRNRITIGGSVKDFPMWSNLYAPLLALDARVVIAGMQLRICPIEEYAGSDLIHSRHLVKEIRVPERSDVVYGIKTFHVVRFEYPIFTIAAAVAMRKGVVREARIFITGVRRKFARLTSTEEVLHGNAITGRLIEEAAGKSSFSFVPDFRFSAEYKQRVARVYLKDLLREIKQAAA